VGAEPFAVLLGDDLIDSRDRLLAAMLAAHEVVGGSVITLMPVPRDHIHLYGSAAVHPIAPGLARQAGLAEGELLAVEKLIEKPSPAEALSEFAVIGRYVLSPAVFDVIEHLPPGAGGEIQLTDAINVLAHMPPEQGGGVHGVVFRGRRYDTGDKLDYLKAVVTLAAQHPELGGPFRDWLATFAAGR
jgi:UTP--glucose-1-phosphate uridylyltransferase